MGTLAVAAVVVEKLDDGHGSLGIAADRIRRLFEQLLGIACDEIGICYFLLGSLFGAQGIGHLDQQLGVADQVLFVITSYSIHYTKLYEVRTLA